MNLISYNVCIILFIIIFVFFFLYFSGTSSDKKMTAGTSKKNSSVGFVTTDTVDSFG